MLSFAAEKPDGIDQRIRPYPHAVTVRHGDDIDSSLVKYRSEPRMRITVSVAELGGALGVESLGIGKAQIRLAQHRQYQLRKPVDRIDLWTNISGGEQRNR